MSIRLAIVGRPNVGKSTLFNRLAGKKLALVDDRPGVTRDRREADGRLGDLDLELIDTAGFEDATDESLEARMRAQTEAAIAQADLCLFLIDARAGVTPVDEIFADILRRSGRPVVLAANKAEGRAGEAGLLEAYGLGFGEPVGISGEHGEGMADLYAAFLATLGSAADPEPEPGPDFAEELPDGQADLDAAPAAPDPDTPLRIAVIGRPNAGKSTLINALVGAERLLTGPEAGITRDAIALDWSWNGRPVRLVDTAGMRRKAKVQEKLEVLSVADTLRAIRFAEICLLVMGADEAFEKQDLQIADLVAREGRGLVYVISKWDQVTQPQARLQELAERAARVLPQTRGAPLVPVSALSHRGLDRLMPAVLDVHEDWNARIKTRDLNDWLQEAITRQPPPAVDGKRVKPRYIAQLKARPPTFVLIASRAAQLPDAYVRYLTNGIRQAFDMPAVPIRFMVRAPKNPYADTGDEGRGRSDRRPGRPGAGGRRSPAPGGAPAGPAVAAAAAAPATPADPAPAGAGGSARTGPGRGRTPPPSGTAAGRSAGKAAGKAPGAKPSVRTSKPATRPSRQSPGRSAGAPSGKSSGRPGGKSPRR